jgi:antitoxin component YwqK of YwqJK toxin-antitoxin module
MVSEWYSSSKKKSTSHYKIGKENGFRIEWNRYGKLTFQGNFVNGNEEIK